MASVANSEIIKMPNMIARGRRFMPAAAGAAALLALSACSLDVLTPNVVPVAATQGQTALTARLNGALTEFSTALSGLNDGNGGEGIALLSGLFADEYTYADYFDTHKQTELRSVQPDNGSNATVLLRLYRAGSDAQAAADAYSAAGQTTSEGYATALNRNAFIFTLLAETYCSGLPFSRVATDGSLKYGAPITTRQMLDTAIAKFTLAATAATAAGSEQEYYAALVGKGRALLDRASFSTADFAAAAATVGPVPTEFVYATEQGTGADEVKSGNYVLLYLSTRFATSNNEGGTGPDFITANDPRLKLNSIGLSQFDQTTDLFAPDKYSKYESPTVIASGVEARLIEAEAALQAGNYNGGAGSTLGILNALRANRLVTPAGLDPLPALSSPQDRVRQLFDERAFALFGTAHRLGDLRRLLRAPYNTAPYNFTAATVFPQGRSAKGGSYGSQVALRVSQAETSNPNYTANACDPTIP